MSGGKSIKRGFITVATGKYYCWLAENLVMSYRLFSDDGIPFGLITDAAGKEYFSKGKRKNLFDELVVLDKPNYSYMDKMMVYYNTPFEETIFLDADAHIVDNISFLFDKFEENGSAVSLNGAFRPLFDNKCNHFGEKATEHFGLNKYIAFNGGMYYFKKSEAAETMMRFIFDVLIPNYDKYELKRFLGKYADEPLFNVALMVFGMNPIEDEKQQRGYMYMPISMTPFEWNMDSESCSICRYDKIFSPFIIHYGTHNTYSKSYVVCSANLLTRYRKGGSLMKRANRMNGLLAYGYRLATHDYYRTLFWPWVKEHFTKKWIERQINRLKKNDDQA